MEERKSQVHIDWTFLLAVLALIVFGFLTIYSTSYSVIEEKVDKEFYMQLVWFLVGLVAFFIIVSVNYQKIVEWSVPIYAFGIFLLVLTLLVGRYNRNIKAWLGVGAFTLQTAEVVKVFVIIGLARFLAMLGDGVRDLRNFFLAFLLIAPPVGLIAVQPDFGTAMVFVPLCFAMLFVAGARISHLMSLIVLSVLAIGIPMVVAYYKELDRMDGWLIRILADNQLLTTVSIVLGVIALLALIINFMVRTKAFLRFALAVALIPIGLLTASFMNSYLQPYQRKRIVIFIDPEMDYYGAGYNIIQSKIAIGSGGFTGKGFMKGTQNQLAFLPEKKTDFVYSSVGEEWGFLGSFFLLGTYFLFVYRGVMIVYRAKDMVGSLLACGIVTMFVFHIFINIGMASGMMPVTGLPLPFISYGGSNLLANMLAVGLLFNIEMRRYVY
jgi:rod shape determining protein RodA